MPDDFDVRSPDPDGVKVTRVDPIHERQALQAWRGRETAPPQRWGTFVFLIILFLGLIFGGGYAMKSGWFATHAPERGPAQRPPAQIEMPKPSTDGVLGQDVILGDYLVRIDCCLWTKLNDRGVRLAVVQGMISNATKEPVDAAAIDLFLYDHLGNKHASTQQGGQYKPNMRINPMLGFDQTWAFVIPTGIKMERGQFELKGGKVVIDLNSGTPELEQKIKAQERERQAKAERDLRMALEFEAKEADRAERAVREAEERKRLEAAKAREAGEKRLADARAQREAETQRLPELQRQLDAAELKLTRARKSIENITYDRSVTLREATSQKQKIDRLQTTIEELRQATATSGRQDSQFAGQLNQAIREHAAETVKLRKVEEYLRQLDQDLTQTKAAAKQAEKDLEAAGAAFADCREAIAKLTLELKQADGQDAPEVPPPPPQE